MNEWLIVGGTASQDLISLPVIYENRLRELVLTECVLSSLTAIHCVLMYNNVVHFNLDTSVVLLSHVTLMFSKTKFLKT